MSESFDHFKSECSAVSNQLIQTFSAQTSEWLKQQLNHDDLRSQALRETLTESEQQLAATLEQTSTQFSDEMHKMVEQQRELVSARVASEQCMDEGHQSASIVERNEFMNALRTLLTSVDQTSKSQRESIEALTRSSSEALFDTSCHFSEHVDAGLSKIKGIADQVSGGAIELSTLGKPLVWP